MLLCLFFPPIFCGAGSAQSACWPGRRRKSGRRRRSWPERQQARHQRRRRKRRARRPKALQQSSNPPSPNAPASKNPFCGCIPVRKHLCFYSLLMPYALSIRFYLPYNSVYEFAQRCSHCESFRCPSRRASFCPPPPPMCPGPWPGGGGRYIILYKPEGMRARLLRLFL
eukprot:jgi/Botrbrau1/15165/Bobra.0149s0030.1